jgi:tetratricopeptide (TPR) repeat protein
MKQLIIAALIISVGFPYAAGQTASQEDAKSVINEGARLYREGNYVEAQRRFERALELDPSHRLAPVFIARALQQQYKAGDDSPENRAKAEEAVAAYQRVLASDSGNEDAYNAVLYLYRQLRDEQQEGEWLMRRATDGSAPREKRSAVYTVLAAKQWSCSYNITEQVENKAAVDKGGRVVIEYKKPKVEADFERARACAEKGLELANQAIDLDESNANARAHQTNLFRELAKLAQMEGDAEWKANYDKQADEAAAAQARLTEEQAKKKTDGEQKNLPGGEATEAQPGARAREAEADALVPSPMRELPLVTPGPDLTMSGRRLPQATPSARPAPKQITISGGVLNAKAISKPEPKCPAMSNVRAQGLVTVQITVDEEGKVASARAAGGHVLLQQPAVAAALLARFSPLVVRGQPARQIGVLTYNLRCGN